MTDNDVFGPRLSTWLHEEAEHRVPDHLGEVLVHTVATRQRPWWSSPERWLPMQTSARLMPLPRTAWLLIVIALVLAVGVTTVVVGSRLLQPPPSPFGAGASGNVVYGTADGDIHVLDTATDQSRPLVTGPDHDGAPVASPDGGVFAFTRRATTGATALMLANADGTDVRSFDAQPKDIVGMDWSPDGDRLAISGSIGGVFGLWVLPIDGAPSLVQMERPGQDIALIREPHWLPNGDDLVFLGGPLETVSPVGLFIIGEDGQGLRTLVEPAFPGPTQMAISPNGASIAFAHGADGQARLHVVEIDGGADTVIALDGSASAWDQRPVWSPDGRSLAFERYDGQTYRLAVASVDGGQVVELGPTQPYRSGGSHIAWSPDGTRVVAFYDADDSTWVLDPAAGSAIQLSAEIATPLTWQRP